MLISDCAELRYRAFSKCTYLNAHYRVNLIVYIIKKNFPYRKLIK